MRTKEEIREQHKVWYEANRERLLAERRAWYQANKEEIKKKRKLIYQANKEKVKARSRAWYQANREYAIQRNSIYNAQKRRERRNGTVSPVETKEKNVGRKGPCNYDCFNCPHEDCILD